MRTVTTVGLAVQCVDIPPLHSATDYTD